MDYPWTYTHKYPGKNNPWIVIKAGSKDELMLRIREMFAEPDEDPNSIVPGVSLDDLVDAVNNPEQYVQDQPAGQFDKTPSQAVASDLPPVDDGSGDQLTQWINEAPDEEALDKLWDAYNHQLTAQQLAAMKARAESFKKGE